MLIGARIATRGVMQSFGRWQRPTLIIADTDRSDQIRRLLQYNPGLGCTVQSELIVDDDDPLLLERITQILQKSIVEHAILNTRGMRSDDLSGATALLDEHGVTFDLSFDSAGAGGGAACVRDGLGSDVAVLVRNAPSGAAGAWMRWKRAFDILASAAAIVITGPLLLVIAALIKLDAGPAIYRSPRIGRGGRTFACLKFRSMKPQADEMLRRMLAERPDLRAEWMANFKLHPDPRVTAVGRWLRASSLDELPQLWNVLKGDMSLVGPRPILTGEQERYGPAMSDYVQLRPGITGPWQIAGRDELEYSQRVLLNSWYLHHISFMTDLNIILRTFGVVLRSNGQ
jgi:lipopolysaccharide/colanic/teichoic acid biosynthesis glycosyltransferase